jgi:dTDP-4-dehydrorhamnose reductase
MNTMASVAAIAVGVALDQYEPAVVLNCAGATGRPNVDWCEANKTATFRSNTIGPMVLAEACQGRQIHFVHMGSGCVFYGPSGHLHGYTDLGWLENDHANPSST